MKLKNTRAWVVIAANGYIGLDTISYLKKDAIEKFKKMADENEYSWGDGWRAIRIKIEATDPSLNRKNSDGV